MKGFSQDLTVGVFGLGTSVLTAVLLWFLERQFGFGIYTWSALFVIPVGAILSGFLAASGYYVGARVFGLRPTWRLLVTMVLISAGCFFLIYYLSYATFEVKTERGVVPVKQLVPFGEFLDASIRSTTIGRVGRTEPGARPLGGWGYLFAVLQVLGFSFGGLAVWGWLASLPYCEACSRYLKKLDVTQRFTDKSENLDSAMQGLEGKAAHEWLDAVRGFGTAAAGKNGFAVRVERRVCPNCSSYWCSLETRVRAGSEWRTAWRADGRWDPREVEAG